MEPDWHTLNEINFLLYSRVADSLNASLSAMTLAEMSEGTGQSAEWWYERAKSKIGGVLNLVMAWSWLIQYKGGIPLAEKVIQSFRLQTLLDWLTVNLQLVPPLTTKNNVWLHANQQTLQEAIMLLHSVANTQGAGVVILLDSADNAIRFRIRFARLRPSTPFKSPEDLIQRQGSHWRQRMIAFELAGAIDFLKMNGITLILNDTGLLGEFNFLVNEPSVRPLPDKPAAGDKHHHQIVAHLANATLPPGITQETLSLQHDRQRWHPPEKVTTFNKQKLPEKRPPDPIPLKPVRQGSWHLPLQPSKRKTQQHVIINVDLPEPALPKRWRDEIARETQTMKRVEPDDHTPQENKTDRNPALPDNEEKSNGI